MKTRITIILFILFVSFNISFAQQDEECMDNLSIFDSYAKSKKYDDAYEPWMIVRNKCPKYSRALYTDNKGKGGKAILKYKIENSEGAEKVDYIKDLILLSTQYNQNFPSKYKTSKMLEDNANLNYKYRKELNLDNKALFSVFDTIYQTHKDSFNNAKSLYTYFSLAVDLYDAGGKTTNDAQNLFDKYDDVIEVIESVEKNYTKKLNKLVSKEKTNTKLTKKELKYKDYYVANLTSFEDKVKPSIDKKLGDRANCEVLIPLYQKDFDKNKNDGVWLQRAMNKMGQKGCTDDPMFEKLVEQKNSIQPDADTAYYLGVLKEKKGKFPEAENYYKQSLDLQKDPLKKWKLVISLAEKNYKKGKYTKARQQYTKALKLNPSNGRPYLRIAAMYAKSANNCGDTNFNKRAVFWLASKEAAKASKVDSRLKKVTAQTVANYQAKAPSKSDIFNCSCSGTSIKIGCWIQRSVTVPKI